MNEENIFIDSGLTKEGLKMHSKEKHCKEGWVDEVESKLKSRDGEIINDDRKVEIKTTSKLLMEFSLEWVEAIKRNKEDLRKINQVRKHERLIFPYDHIGSSGMTLKS